VEGEGGEGEGVGVGGWGEWRGREYPLITGGGGGSSFLWAARMTIVMVGNKYAGIVIPSFLYPFIRKGVKCEIFRKGAKKHLEMWKVYDNKYTKKSFKNTCILAWIIDHSR
jgi:hypothetical protein